MVRNWINKNYTAIIEDLDQLRFDVNYATQTLQTQIKQRILEVQANVSTLAISLEQDVKTSIAEVQANVSSLAISLEEDVKVRLKPIEDQIQVHFVDRPRTSCSELSLEGVTADGFYEIKHVAFEGTTELLQCNLSHPLGSYLNPAESCRQLEAVGTNLSFPNVYFMRPEEFKLDPRVDIPALTPCLPIVENGTEVVVDYEKFKSCYALQQMNYTEVGEYWAESGVRVFCNLSGVVAVGGSGAVGSASNAYVNTAERYDPVTKQWEDVTSMKSSREGVRLVVLTDPTDNKQYIYAVGGYGAVGSATNTYLNTAERI